MTIDRKKPGVAFWATVVVAAVLVAYPLSFGPACWITARTDTDRSALFTTIYGPLGGLIYKRVPVAADFLTFLASIGLPRGGGIVVPGSRDEFGEAMLLRE
jgi:hypothetical protein